MNKDVKNKKVTVLGAARSGIAAAVLLKNSGAEVFVSDYAKKDIIPALHENDIDYESGMHSERVFDADFVVLSPGISQRTAIVKELMAKDIPVYSEIEVASWFCKSPVIGVTGSNGKTTTTTLIGEMLKRRYSDAIVAGNIGQPFSSFVLDSKEDSRAVVELSSFQLETTDRFKPQTVVVLNFAPNHLDWYDSYDDYKDAKWRITNNLTEDDLLVYNADDVEASTRADLLNCRKLSFSVKEGVKADAYFSDGKLWLNDTLLIDVDTMQLRGLHNYMNALAAALAAKEAGVEAEKIKEVLQEFAGVEHRLEYVKEVNGVKYYNDSKATTVESLWFALKSFTTPIILIAGGKDKGSDFTRLNDLILDGVKKIIVIGTASEKMEKAWGALKPLEMAESLESAVLIAKNSAENGEVVLLSPACASFDMFQDFEDRGRQFKEVVNNLDGEK
jgi:UDP-N-acetylmuramoylalanine--D-glutamate ligase